MARGKEGDEGEDRRVGEENREMDKSGKQRRSRGEKKREEVKNGGESKKMEERVRRIERLWEVREREERKNNIIMKGLKEKGEGMEIEIKKLLKKLGAEEKLEGVRRLDVGRKELGDMAVVKLGNSEEKRKIMENKRKLKGKECVDRRRLIMGGEESKIETKANSNERRGKRD